MRYFFTLTRMVINEKGLEPGESMANRDGRRHWGDEKTMEPVGGPVNLTDEQAKRWFEGMITPGRSPVF